MHQEPNARDAAAAASTAHSAMSATPSDEQGAGVEGRDGRPFAEGGAMRRRASVVTPAVERVLAWHQRRSM